MIKSDRCQMLKLIFMTQLWLVTFLAPVRIKRLHQERAVGSDALATWR